MRKRARGLPRRVARHSTRTKSGAQRGRRQRRENAADRRAQRGALPRLGRVREHAAYPAPAAARRHDPRGSARDRRLPPVRRRGDRRRAGGLRGGVGRGQGRRRRDAGRALQLPRRAFHRRPGHVDRPHDRLAGQPRDPGLRPRVHRAHAARGASPGRRARTGARPIRSRSTTGRTAPPPSTASSSGRRRSIPR